MIAEGAMAVVLVIIHKPCNMAGYILAGNLNHGMMISYSAIRFSSNGQANCTNLSGVFRCNVLIVVLICRQVLYHARSVDYRPLIMLQSPLILHRLRQP